MKKTEKKRKRRTHPLVVSMMVLCIGIGLYMAEIPFFERMELVTMDLRFQIRGPRETGNQIVLAVIDEKSIDKEGKWVWPRRKFVQMIDRLSEAGAAVIGFDVGFLETDTQDEAVIETVETIRRAASAHQADPEFQKFLNDLRGKADQDALLAESIARCKAHVVLGYFFLALPEESAHLDPATLQAQEESIANSRYNSTHFPPGMQEVIGDELLAPLSESKILRDAIESRMAQISEVAAPQANIPVISRQAESSGFFNIIPDPDGSVRNIDLFIHYKNNLYVPLSLKVAAAFLNKQLFIQVAEDGVRKVKLCDNPVHVDQPGDIQIPTDAEGRMYINYRGPEGTFPHISITDILSGNVPREMIAGKIVLVGATAIGIYDMRVTPFGSVFPGLEVHANVVDNILQQDFLERPAWISFLDMTVMVALCLILGLVLPRVSVTVGTLITTIVFAGYLMAAFFAETSMGLIINIVYPILVIIGMYAGITLYQFVIEVRQKRYIKDAFSHYLAPSVVKQLVDSQVELELGGEERNITAFFSDLQGFTGISENMEPKQLVELLNAFLTDMTDIILRYEGTVDKFEGDAIIAIFGAPTDMPDHPLRACMAALDMQKRLAERREEWRLKYGSTLWMRIGLCTSRSAGGKGACGFSRSWEKAGRCLNPA